MSEPDPLIRQLREQISDNDRAIVEAINTRLRLVARHSVVLTVGGACEGDG